LGKLRAQGKVCHFGVSCESTADAYICLRYPQLSTLQIRVNLLDQSAVTDFLPQAFARGLAIIARECFAGGILAKPPSERHLDGFIIDPEERAIRSRQLELLDQFAARIGRSVPELALQFVIGLSGINTALLGMRSSVQMLQNRALWQADPLSPAEYQQLTTLLIEPN
jgi:aryl-alcohol dehydrogenase-like predicted oxidoreductase